MIRSTTLKVGLQKLGKPFGREIDVATIAVYREALSELDDAAWERAVNYALKTERFFPPPAALLEAARKTSCEVPVQAKAVEAYERIWAIRSYTPYGATWDRGRIERETGIAGLRAFSASGGALVWRDMNSQSAPHVQRLFVQSYVESCSYAGNGSNLLESGKRKALPSGRECDGEEIGRHEAGQILGKLMQSPAKAEGLTPLFSSSSPTMAQDGSGMAKAKASGDLATAGRVVADAGDPGGGS